MTAASNDWGEGSNGSGWEEQRDDSPLCKLGDGEGQVAECRGLLTRVSIDRYNNPMFHTQLQDGSSVRLCSNATLADQLSERDIGELFIASFGGWGKPKNGGKPYKIITVTVYRAPTLTPELAKAFPRWRKIAAPAPSAEAAVNKYTGVSTPVGTSDDDDLPF